MLEAVRWAATWGRRQPVRFVVGIRRDATLVALVGLLKPGNSYARAASALILVCADHSDDDRTAVDAALDSGAAIAQLSIDAQSRSLVVHPMAGFEAGAAHAMPFRATSSEPTTSRLFICAARISVPGVLWGRPRPPILRRSRGTMIPSTALCALDSAVLGGLHTTDEL
ncbi:hypothetical protein A4G26_21450 [Mycobacterium kansasii]|uniref:Uncharacterized protein n=1 Tax=Mycobacterium innocens TaxID=2341083 RepID=A0A498QG28_9MYCO|nr:hypothetical protein A4G26_21450 [Mycobacterium kansasii]VBA43552.1 hypothetical protein LAUMK13_04585 [Mycobacterium innocens]